MGLEDSYYHAVKCPKCGTVKPAVRTPKFRHCGKLHDTEKNLVQAQAPQGRTTRAGPGGLVDLEVRW